MPTINKREQTRILKTINEIAITSDDPQKTWRLALIGVVVALNEASPPHWTMNLMAGRADRLREELKEGLKPTPTPSTAASQAMIDCPECNGFGYLNDRTGDFCARCNSTGKIPS